MVDVNTGLLEASDGSKLLHVFEKFHSLGKLWFQFQKLPSRFESREQIDQKSRDVLKCLTTVDAARWSTLCAAAGWTVYGAVALSWCEGAKIEDVWAGWLASGFPLKPLPEFERPARFINPALLPPTNKSGEINATMKEVSPNSETYQLAVCATIAALKEPLEFELEPNGYKGAMPQIAAFLKSRMLQKPDKTPEENAIIDVWSEKIKGTEWDIWNKEGA